MKKLILFLFVAVLAIPTAYGQLRKLKAGPDKIINAGESVHLQGQSVNVGLFAWETSGTGTFSDNKALDTYYTPSHQDIRSGKVELTLINHNRRVSDVMQLTLKCFIVNAGPNMNLCGYEWGGEIPLHLAVIGTSAGATDITWSTHGYGDFDNSHSAYTTYFYDMSDVNLAAVDFYATAETRGCPVMKDTVHVNLHAAPRVYIQDPVVTQIGDEPVNANVTLGGYASSGIWTTAGSGWFDDPGATFTLYHPSDDDRRAGCIDLTFTSNDPQGPCGPASGTMTACFNAPCPTVSIGSDITICGYHGGGEISLDAAVSGYAESISWQTSGSGSFGDPNSFNTTYSYSGSDVDNASIEISATVSAYGCYNTAVLVLNLQAAPELQFPEPTTSTCYGAPAWATVYLYGYASSGTWTTTGSGTFENPAETSTLYHPGPSDVGSYVTLMFTTNDPEGPCGWTSGYMEVYVEDCGTLERTGNPVVTVYPNPAQDIATLKTSAALDATKTFVTNAMGDRMDVTWTGQQINVTQLPRGVYLLHTTSTEGKEYTVRFSKF